jgi:hypothetical protein
MNWSALFALLGAVLIGWLILRMIRGNPQSFSKENMGKSVRTLGLLALFLILVIAAGVLFIRG